MTYKRPFSRSDLPADLPYCSNLQVLAAPCHTGGRVLPNRIVYQPMEGCDGTADGAPGELTIRRYHRFAHGGPGVIWFEATAVLPEARANPRQMWLTENNLSAFAKLLSDIREISVRENGYAPVILCQLTHSGRYSKPNGVPAPLVAQHRPLFEKECPLPESCILSDSYLAALPEHYARSAALPCPFVFSVRLCSAVSVIDHCYFVKYRKLFEKCITCQDSRMKCKSYIIAEKMFEKQLTS